MKYMQHNALCQWNHSYGNSRMSIQWSDTVDVSARGHKS